MVLFGLLRKEPEAFLNCKHYFLWKYIEIVMTLKTKNLPSYPGCHRVNLCHTVEWEISLGASPRKSDSLIIYYYPLMSKPCAKYPRDLVSVVGEIRLCMSFITRFCSSGERYKLQVKWFIALFSWWREATKRDSIERSAKKKHALLPKALKEPIWDYHPRPRVKQGEINQVRNKHHPKETLKKEKNLKVRKLQKIFCVYIKTLNPSTIASFQESSTYNFYPQGKSKIKILWTLVVGVHLFLKKGFFFFVCNV